MENDDREPGCLYWTLLLLLFMSPFIWVLLTVTLSNLFPRSVFGISLNPELSFYDPKVWLIFIIPPCILFEIIIIKLFDIELNFGKIILSIIALIILSVLMFFPIMIFAIIVDLIMRGLGFVTFIIVLAVLALLTPPATAVVLIIKR